MIDMIQILNEIFGNRCLTFCEEVLYKFQIGYKIRASALPAVDKLDYLCSKCLERDSI